MTLLGFLGNKNEVQYSLLIYALKNNPALIIDAGNCANTHVLPLEHDDKFKDVYVIPAESLYRFYSALKEIPETTSEIKVKKIIITPFDILFNYDNEQENKKVFLNSWRLIKRLSSKYDIIVGVIEQGVHEDNAKRFCDEIIGGENMGHTVYSQRMNTDIIINELSVYAKSLPRNEKELFESIIKQPLKHFGNISYASSVHGWAFLLVSIILEQEKKIKALESLL